MTNVSPSACFLCDNPAAFRIDGFLDGGDDNYSAYAMVCADHVTEFREWQDLYEKHTAGLTAELPFLHGWTYIDSIEPIGEGK